MIQYAKKFKKIDITMSKYPGIYEMLDIKNNMSYYGQTDCLANRLARHFYELNREKHDNKMLSKAYKTEKNPDNFRFFILKYGPELKDPHKRLHLQAQYIKMNAHRCYNVINPTPVKRIRPIMVRETYYRSIRDAARQTGIAKTSLKRFCDDPINTEFYFVNDAEQAYGCIPIFGKKGKGPSVLFNSYLECIEAGYATSTQNARRKIQRQQEGWRYAALHENGKPMRVPYQLKAGEFSYTMFQKTNLNISSLLLNLNQKRL